MFIKRFLTFQKYGKYSLNPVFRRNMSENHGGVCGGNIPFSKCVGNPKRCAMMFILFFGTGLWVPCVAFVYLMHK